MHKKYKTAHQYLIRLAYPSPARLGRPRYLFHSIATLVTKALSQCVSQVGTLRFSPIPQYLNTMRLDRGLASSIITTQHEMEVLVVIFPGCLAVLQVPLLSLHSRKTYVPLQRTMVWPLEKTKNTVKCPIQF